MSIPEMKRRVLLLCLALLGGSLPLVLYWLQHGSLGTISFGGYQGMTQGEQIAQVAAGLYIKTTYMLLSLALIIVLSGPTETEMVSLKWGLIAFLAGEVFCAVNFFIYGHKSLISEYIHSYGMVLGFGLVAFALLEGAERYLLHINQGRCALGVLCNNCQRASPARCAARRISMLMAGLAGMLSLLPLAVQSEVQSYETSLFGYPYSYARFSLYQWYETRALPVAALVFFLLALIPLLQAGGDPIPRLTRIFFSAGMGALGFAFFRVVLSSLFRDNLVWFEFWEELTEFMFIAATAFFLWQFRGTLLDKSTVLRFVEAGGRSRK